MILNRLAINPTEQQLSDLRSQLLFYRVEDLRPHAAYVRNRIRVPACKLDALAKRGDLAFREPVVITTDCTIIDGYARFELARLQQRPTLLCVQHELTEIQALHWLLQSHRRSDGLNDFSRILLALDMESLFQATARANQSAGGQNRGSSKLTKAQTVDARSEIARLAGVSAGNVTKVKQLLMNAIPEVLDALRAGELRIHRAWRWLSLSKPDQREALWNYQSDKGVKRTIRALVSRHGRRPSVNPLDLDDLCARLSVLEPPDRESVKILVTAARGKVITVSKELLEHLRFQRGLSLIADNSSSRELPRA